MLRDIQNPQGAERLLERKGEFGRSKLREVCREFESLLVYEMIKTMRRTVSKCDLFGSGQGEEMYEQLLDQQLSKSLSARSPFGLAEMLYQQLLTLQERGREAEPQRTQRA